MSYLLHLLLLHRLLCNEEECNSVTVQLNHASILDLSLSLSDEEDENN